MREFTIIVPAYNAPDDLRRAIESVLACSTPPYRLLVIDDASPDPAVGEFLGSIARRSLPHVTIDRNAANLGFVGTCNRGFAMTRGDVILLNSDAVVTRGWLERMRRCAESDPKIGTITPFSNNAEICSFPDLCGNHPWSDDDDPEPVAAAIARAAIPLYPELPTGVGFCMFVRREVLDECGGFDTAYGAGYGEENDLCRRAAARGFRNVLLDDTFVVHRGGRSFSEARRELQRRNLAILLERHPDYSDVVARFIAADPLASIRAWACARQSASDHRRGILHVIHSHGGGTEKHVRDLIAASSTEFRHYVLIAEGQSFVVEDHSDRSRGIAEFHLGRTTSESAVRILGGIVAAFEVTICHVHNLSGAREAMIEAIPALGIPFGYTFHDLNFACPTITFLGGDGEYCNAETDPARCTSCLGSQREFTGVDIVDWRERHRRFLALAEFLIAPSHWAADTARRYFDTGPMIDVISHGVPASAGATGGERSRVRPLRLPDDGLPTVAFIGAIGPDKGSRRIEAMVERARARSAPVRFVLLGYMDCLQTPWQSEDHRFSLHGRYSVDELPELFDHYRVRLVVFPSACPETFGYTLSESWQSGRPVLVPPFGALAERVSASGGGWQMRNPRDVDTIIDQILTIVAASGEAEYSGVLARIRSIHHATLDSMSGATAGLYRRLAPGLHAFPPLSNRRMTTAAENARQSVGP